ncbi:S-adenosyl-L-methionine-dependent methyltransferase [Xylariales sp. AK1849]|nr:S-adenosyl-L-methionine-dependent methyltransferase [Xylariales sp. AK1849]
MSSSIYILNNGENQIEEKRLEYQHGIFLKLTGRLLPDAISKYLETTSSPQVADIGTGTGVWLRGLAEQLPPSSRLDGYDFDISKFPPEKTLPHNTRLSFGNILEPFPSELHGKYDVVHVRLLMFGLKTDQWDFACRNLTTLLKPGGWILWEETGYHSWVCFPMSKAWNEYIDLDSQAALSFGRDPRTPLFLLSQVKGAGFVDCEETSFNSTPIPGLQNDITQVMRAICAQSLNGLIGRGGIEGMRTKEDSERLQVAIAKDFETCQPNFAMTWVWGRKS